MSGAAEPEENAEPVESCGNSVQSSLSSDKGEGDCVAYEEEEPLLQMVECRICQEEEYPDKLEMPCNCSGSLKYAHRMCVQRWCNEKGDITCEICHEQYKPGYTAPPQIQPEDTVIDISDGWTFAGTTLDLHDPRLLAMAAAQRNYLDAEYDDYSSRNTSGAAFCRSAALIIMALVLLRHAFNMNDADGDDDPSAVFTLFLLRAAAFLLPCYIVAWIVSIWQQHRQRQEAAAMAATEVAFILQSTGAQGFQLTIAPDSTVTPQQEPQ